MRQKSQAARRREGDQRAASRRDTRKTRDAARAASGNIPQPQNVAPMKGTLLRDEKEKHEAKKRNRALDATKPEAQG